MSQIDDLKDALSAYEREDYKIAYKLFLRLAEEGLARAQVNLGRMYDFGEGLFFAFNIFFLFSNIIFNSLTTR